MARPTTPKTDIEAAMTAPVHTSDYQRGDVAVRLSFPQAMGLRVPESERLSAHLEITDRASGQVILLIPLNAAQFLSMMSSSAAEVSGVELPRHPHLLGKRSQATGIDIEDRYGNDVPIQTRVDAALVWYRDRGWLASARRTNSGFRVQAHRWLNDDDTPVTH